MNRLGIEFTLNIINCTIFLLLNRTYTHLYQSNPYKHKTYTTNNQLNLQIYVFSSVFGVAGDCGVVVDDVDGGDGVGVGCTFGITPKFSFNSCISVVPCNKRLTPRGRPRHDDKFIELNILQCLRISFTASTDTDEPHKFI